MKKQIIVLGGTILIILSVLYMVCITKGSDSKESFAGSNMVDVNEIVQLSKEESKEGQRLYQEKMEKLKEKMESQEEESITDHKEMTILYVGVCTLVIVFLSVVYVTILRPFEKLKEYASEIAAGNLEVELQYERTNYFGAFTWAFDHMRREIIKAKAYEKQAIENNKTVIATLSHDIKTPIASIRAYAEGLDAGLNKSVEKRHKYIDTIMRKCDEVTELTNDLFLHSISDMNKLTITCKKEQFQPLFHAILSEQKGAFHDLNLTGIIPDVTVDVDVKRFTQVMENVIGNARKYAGGQIDINCTTTSHELVIAIKDHGEGIPEEDLPFIFDKFYRGGNTKDKQGAGLGLYIVKYVMEQMSGTVTVTNTYPGLLIQLILPITIS